MKKITFALLICLLQLIFFGCSHKPGTKAEQKPPTVIIVVNDRSRSTRSIALWSSEMVKGLWACASSSTGGVIECLTIGDNQSEEPYIVKVPPCPDTTAGQTSNNIYGVLKQKEHSNELLSAYTIIKQAGIDSLSRYLITPKTDQNSFVNATLRTVQVITSQKCYSSGSGYRRVILITSDLCSSELGRTPPLQQISLDPSVKIIAVHAKISDKKLQETFPNNQVFPCASLTDALQCFQSL